MASINISPLRAGRRRGGMISPTFVPPVTVNFAVTGSAQSFLVPSGVTSATVTVIGSAGLNGFGLGTTGAGFGNGAKVTGTLVVIPGETLGIYVGSGVFNGGGASPFNGGNGGGASDIRRGGAALANRIVVAGGGGGGAYISTSTTPYAGGASGNDSAGSPGTSVYKGKLATQGGGGAGGTKDSGGTASTAGVLGVGGDGASYTSVSPFCGGGGGGGGYYGGGGGGVSQFTAPIQADGGGGGSSLITGLTGAVLTDGFNAGVGSISITYTPV